jgi:hypothetical protein
MKFSEDVNAVMRGEGKARRVRAVPGFAATLCSGLRGVYGSLIYRQAAVTVL